MPSDADDGKEALRLECLHDAERLLDQPDEWIAEVPRQAELRVEYGWEGHESSSLDSLRKDKDQSDAPGFLEFVRTLPENPATVFSARPLTLLVVCSHGHFMKSIRKALGAPVPDEVSNYEAFALVLRAGRWEALPMDTFPIEACVGRDVDRCVVLVRHCPRLCQGVDSLNPLAKQHTLRDPRCTRTETAATRERYWSGLLALYRSVAPVARCVAASCLRRAQETAFQFLSAAGEVQAPPVFWNDPIHLTTSEEARCTIPLLPYCKESYNRLVWDNKDMCHHVRDLTAARFAQRLREAPSLEQREDEDGYIQIGRQPSGMVEGVVAGESLVGRLLSFFTHE